MDKNKQLIKTVPAGPRSFRAVVDLGGGPSTTVAAFKCCTYLGRATYVGWYPTGINAGHWVSSRAAQPIGSIPIPAETQDPYFGGEPTPTKVEPTRTTTKEIRRDGQRILKAGANVRVQLKRAKGTKRDDGHIVECYSDGTVKVQLHDLGKCETVAADEWVVARAGTTPIRKEA
tara:strand:+ start:8993 stop:9514 length:522 start_codon:yes stop_codon:yes gene_type:complete